MHTEVQHDAAVLHTESVLIEAPAEQVYEIISDVEHWPVWQSAINRTQMHGTCRKGCEFKWHSSGMVFKSLVHTARPPEEFGWVARSMWFKVVYNWTLEPEGHQTRVTIEESLTGLGAELMRNVIRSSMKLTLMELKKYSESLLLVNV